VSEVGFGLWRFPPAGGNFTEGEAIALMPQGFDSAVRCSTRPTLTAMDWSEELTARRFRNNVDEITIATKVGYDFVQHGEARGRGQREIPQDFRRKRSHERPTPR